VVTKTTREVQAIGEDELHSIRGGGIISGLKRAAKWVKNHVVATTKSIAVKFHF
jgi:hypothetical protein